MIDAKMSVKNRLIFWSALLLFLVTAGLIWYNYTTSMSETRKMNEAIIIGESNERNLMIISYFNELYEITKGFAIATTEIKDDSTIVNKRDVIENIAKGILENNDDIAGIEIGFELNLFDGRDSEYEGNSKYGENGEFTQYIYKTDDGIQVLPIKDYGLLDLYVIPKTTDKPIITEPYIYTINGENQLFSTISVPLFDSEEFIGVIGISVTMDSISSLICSSPSNVPLRSLLVTSEGTIVANNVSEDNRLEHISKHYREYNDDFRVVNNEGIKTRYEDNLYQVLLPLSIKDTNTNWYLFSDVEKSYILNKTYNHVLGQIAIVVILTIVVLFVLTIVITKILKPFITFTNKISRFEVDDIDNFPVDIENIKYKEVSILAKAFDELLNKINVEFDSKNKRDKLLRNQKDLIDLLHRNRVLHDLGSKLIRELTKKSKGQLGVFYIKDKSLNKTRYYRLASYAFYSNANTRYTFSLGEGLVGQAALDKEIKIIEKIPSEYYQVSSGIGEVIPRNLAIVPCYVSDDVVAIFEIGSIHKFDEDTLKYFDSVRFDIASSLESILAYEQTNRLLAKTTEQREELDLRQTELKLQKEELRITNDELEASINQLEYKNRELEAAHLINNKRAEELEQLNRFKSEFLANMSHELRTPLNSILILSELLQENKELNNKDLQYAETIRRSGEDLLELINDVLDLSKVEAGKETVNLCKIDIDEFLEELKLDFTPVAVKDNTNFSIEKYKDVPKELLTDQRKVKQILKNLIANALKFTKGGKVSLSVILNDSNCLFVVKDDGIGISKDKQDMIFSAFKQEDGSISRNYGGTGLGLSISKEYALLLGGDIILESEQDKGSTFTLSLPIGDIDLKDSNNETEQSEFEYYYIPDDRHSIRDEDDVVLMVDDDPSFTRLVMEYLRTKNFKVIVTNSGENALHLADFYLPICIILDVRLPGIDGYETIDRLSGNIRTKDIPVYITSGAEREKSADKATRFIQKPINLNQIQEIMNEALDKKIKNTIIIFEDDTKRLDLRDFIQENYSGNVICESQPIPLDKEENINLVVLNLKENYQYQAFIESLKNNDIPAIVYLDDINDKFIELDNFINTNSYENLLDEIKLFLNKLEILSPNLEIDFKNKTVLIVDDDMRNVFSLSSLLESSGINVKFVNSGEEAIDMLETTSIDLVLMDIMMHNMDGYQAMSIIRNKKKFEKLPIIAITAKAMKGDRDKCIKAGANEYCPKPIEKNKLLSILRVWL